MYPNKLGSVKKLFFHTLTNDMYMVCMDQEVMLTIRGMTPSNGERWHHPKSKVYNSISIENPRSICSSLFIFIRSDTLFVGDIS